MYTKEQLEQMPIPELMEVAGQLGVKVSQDDTMENVIYEILDKAAIESASGASATKRKRTRIAKKDTDKVYSVRGKEGENLDVKNQKNKAPEAPSLFADLPEPQAESQAPAVEAAPAEEPKPKRSGRKSKAELAAIAAAEAAKQAQEAAAAQEEKVKEDLSDIVPEASADFSSDEEPAVEMLEQLQEKMSRHQEMTPDMQSLMEDEDIWEGDLATEQTLLLWWTCLLRIRPPFLHWICSTVLSYNSQNRCSSLQDSNPQHPLPVLILKISLMAMVSLSSCRMAMVSCAPATTTICHRLMISMYRPSRLRNTV